MPLPLASHALRAVKSACVPYSCTFSPSVVFHHVNLMMVDVCMLTHTYHP